VINAPPFAEPTKKARWDYAGYLGDRPSHIQSKNVGLLLYARAFMWFDKIATFRAAEASLIYGRKPGKVLREQHRIILEGLIQQGNEIIRRAQAGDRFIKPANGFSLHDVQSAVEELENTQLQWNGGMSKKRKAEILRDVFDAS
jgi:hypothetical protein